MTRPRVKTAPASSQARPDLPKSPTIAAVMNSPDLFGPHFRRSFDAWRAFLAGLFAIPMKEDQQAIFTAQTGRMVMPQTPFKEAAVIVGRRGGKSRILALIAVYLACFRSYDQYLAPGEMATIAILASNRSQARSIFRYVSGLLKATPLLASMVSEEGAESITLVSKRVVIEISTASFRTTRGYSFAAVLCDEIAFWRQDEASANPDVEILRALRPGMASIPGSILLLASSPYAKKGELYNTYRKHYGKNDGRVLVWKAPTEVMNPGIDPAIIAEAYTDDPEAAAAEYGAEFRSDLADFVTREVVDAVTAWGRTELPPQDGISYTAFCDPSGGASDAMTLAIAHMSSNGVPVLDLVKEARPPFDPESVVMEFAEVLKKYGIDRAMSDKYGGEWVVQRFREHGIFLENSAAPKSEIYLNLLPLLNAGRVELLENPRLSAQLVGLERRTARSGRDTVDHTPGGHDDLVNAVAGALVNLDLDRRPALISRSSMLQNADAVAWPSIADLVYGTFTTDKAGNCACVFMAKIPGERSFVLLDFIAGPQNSGSIGDCIEYLKHLRTKMRVRYAVECFFPDSLLIPVRQGGYEFARAIPDGLLTDPQATALNAATWIARPGSVLISDIADQHAKVSPLGGALSIRSGEDMSSALRAAFLVSVNIALVR